MRLVDTSAWIEWLIDSEIGKSVEAALPRRNEWLVPTIVQLELAKWLTREADEDKADQGIAFSATCIVIAPRHAARSRGRRDQRPPQARDR
jgi:uncharacterized protein with PIN domain